MPLKLFDLFVQVFERNVLVSLFVSRPDSYYDHRVDFVTNGVYDAVGRLEMFDLDTPKEPSVTLSRGTSFRVGICGQSSAG